MYISVFLGFLDGALSSGLFSFAPFNVVFMVFICGTRGVIRSHNVLFLKNFLLQFFPGFFIVSSSGGYHCSRLLWRRVFGFWIFFFCYSLWFWWLICERRGMIIVIHNMLPIITFCIQVCFLGFSVSFGRVWIGRMSPFKLNLAWSLRFWFIVLWF